MQPQVGNARRKPSLCLVRDLALEHGQGAAVVEFVDVERRACEAGVDHECVLDKQGVSGVWMYAGSGFYGWCCWL